jgi:hypothetical protein
MNLDHEDEDDAGVADGRVPFIIPEGSDPDGGRPDGGVPDGRVPFIIPEGIAPVGVTVGTVPDEGAEYKPAPRENVPE